MKLRLLSLFLCLHAGPSFAWKIKIHRPWASLLSDQQGKCLIAYNEFVYEPLTTRGAITNREISQEQAVEDMWNFIGPLFDHRWSQATKDKKKAYDKTLPPEHVAYVEAVDEVTGNTVGRIRVVVNNARAGEIFQGPANSENKSGVLPIEHSYPGLTAYLNKEFPVRMEIGRLGALEELGRNRLSAVTQMVLSATELVANEGRPIEVTAEGFSGPGGTDLIYMAFGLKPIDVAAVQKVSPEFKEQEGVKLLHNNSQDLLQRSERNLVEAIQTISQEAGFTKAGHEAKLKRIDGAIAEFPPRMQWAFFRAYYERAKTLLELNRYSEVLQEIERLEKRGINTPEVRDLKLAAEVLSRFDPTRGTGNAEQARRFLAAKETGEIYQDVRHDALVSDIEYYQAWIALEAGDAGPAQSLLRQNQQQIEDLRKTGERNAGVQARADFYVQVHLRDRAYDPRTGRGDLKTALAAVDSYMLEPPFGLSAEMHQYKGEVLQKLGRAAEAAGEFRKAEALRPPTAVPARR